MKFLKRTSKFIKRLTVMGNVGVGTDTPTAKLDVDGDLKVGLLPTSTNNTEVVVVDADGNFFKRQVSTLFADDLHITDASYDDVANILTITLSDTSTLTVDLNDLVDVQISTLQDADADTKVWIEEATGADFVHVESAGTSVAKFSKENIELNKVVKFEKGYALNLRAVNASDTVLSTDHVLMIDPTVSGIIMTLPAVSTLPAGKVFEFKMKNTANSVSITADAADTINDLPSFNLNHNYVRIQADTINNKWVIMEEVRAGGFLVEETAPTSGTTRTYTELIGYTVNNFDFLRDGLIESNTSEFTFNSTTGEITVTEGFEEELIQLRLN